MARQRRQRVSTCKEPVDVERREARVRPGLLDPPPVDPSEEPHGDGLYGARARIASIVKRGHLAAAEAVTLIGPTVPSKSRTMRDTYTSAMYIRPAQMSDAPSIC